MKTPLILLLGFVSLCRALTFPCMLRYYSYGSVCVCNATYCDTLDELNPKGPNGFILVSSSEGGLRFSVTKGRFDHGKQYFISDYNKRNTRLLWDKIKLVQFRNKRFLNYENDYEGSIVKIKIDRKISYQKIIGFGGAMTGSVSHNLEIISPSLRYQIYRSYFSKNLGIGYNFLRMSIGGCDFDLNPWAYNELPVNDKSLSNFTKLDPRDITKINQIKELEEISNNYGIKLFASAWSPPPWMKNNNAWTGISHLKSEYFQTWADYHLKYLELMASKNMSLWAISTGNEPLNGVIGWLFVHFMSLGWTPKYQGKWVAENLGPTIRKSVFKNVKIFGNDDQRYTFPWWFDEMEKYDINSTKYLDGLAVHWYWDKIFGPNLLNKTHQKYSDKIILNTESCAGDKPWEYHGPELGNWKRAEKYITSYIEDFQYWVNGWIDWNLVLDDQGGPNYVKNYVDAPIIINTTSKSEFYKQPIFYAIGHFSKFIYENSIRIDAISNDKNVNVVAFQRTDNNIVAVIYNCKKIPVLLEFLDSDHHNDNIVIKIPPKSVHTIIYK